MCGIVSYVGSMEAGPFLVETLKNLAYRGYDSAGIAVVNSSGELVIEKAPGKLEELEKLLDNNMPTGTMGVGHTRWATHGVPTYINAHPHMDCSGNIVVIQNGIIENYLPLKEKLIAEGHQFVSQTDTEVLAHLVEKHYQGDLKEAVKKALVEVQGSFALVFMHKDERYLVAARMNAPLIIGLGYGENYIASDIPALLSKTNKFYILNNGDIVKVAEDIIEVDTFVDGPPISASNRHISIVDWTVEETSKKGYQYYMLKEIMEQPRVVHNATRGRLSPKGEVKLDLAVTDEHLRRAKRIHLVACGTAYHACIYGKYILEEMLGLPVTADIASEFRYRKPVVHPRDLVVLVSQSGETADTLASLDSARELGATSLAITNVQGSSIARHSDSVLYTYAGPEIAVASTKAFIAQLTVLLLLGLYLSDIRGVSSKVDRKQLIKGLNRLPSDIDSLLARQEEFKGLADQILDDEHCYFLGRNLDEPIAREGALKLKEISYIHAEAYAAGELKHGTIALVEDGTPVVAIMTQESVIEKTLSNVQEVRARQARVFGLVCEGTQGIEEHCTSTIYLPRSHRMVMPIMATVPLQLLAYYAALGRGCDVDQPRNLAKSVTVE